MRYLHTTADGAEPLDVVPVKRPVDQACHVRRKALIKAHETHSSPEMREYTARVLTYDNVDVRLVNMSSNRAIPGAKFPSYTYLQNVARKAPKHSSTYKKKTGRDHTGNPDLLLSTSLRKQSTSEPVEKGKRIGGTISYRVIPSIFSAGRVGPSLRNEVSHRQVVGKLEPVPHVRLPPAQHGGVHGHGESCVASRKGALHKLRRDHAVLLDSVRFV